MAKEYKVTVDMSLLSNHDAEVLEKHMQDLAREGWELKHVTSVPESRSVLAQTSRIYMIWEREVGARNDQAGKENFGALVRKQLGGTTNVR
jgi:uncharacterized protein DUF4177